MSSVADRRMVIFTCSFIGIFLPVSMAVEAGGSSLLLVLGVGLPLIVTGLWVYVGARYKAATVGRGRTRRSVWARRLAKLVGYRLTPCGCTHAELTDRFGPDRTPDATAVEESAVWLRKNDGARIQFRRAVEQLKRCHRCGRHYHDIDLVDPRKFPRDVRYECWLEDEPDVVAAFDVPVREWTEVDA